MASLKDIIKAEAKGCKIGRFAAEQLVIEQTLNKLFYLPHNLKEELKFLSIKRGADATDRYGLHASAILTGEKEFCYREQVLSLFYKQAQGENIPIGLKRIFTEGDAIHEKWQRLFIRGKLGDAKAMDISRFNKEYDLSFTPDICPAIIAGKRYVVEIKSMNTFQFKKATGHPSGEKQLKFYMWLTGIRNGFVLCEDKNDQNFKIFIVEYKEADLAEYIERLEVIQLKKRKFKKDKKAPKRICQNANTKRALKCNMRLTCWGLPGGRIKL